MWIDHVPEDAAEGTVKEIYERSRVRGRGRVEIVPDIVKSTTLRPEATRLRVELSHAVTFGGSQLGRRREEMIATLISALNLCPY